MLPFWSTLARHRQAFELFELKAQLQDQELSRPKKSPGGCFLNFVAFFLLLFSGWHLKLTSEESWDIGFFSPQKMSRKIWCCNCYAFKHFLAFFFLWISCFCTFQKHQHPSRRKTQGTTAKCLESRLASEGAMGDLHGLTAVIVWLFKRKRMDIKHWKNQKTWFKSPFFQEPTLFDLTSTP